MIVSQRSKRFLRRIAVVVLLVFTAVGGSLAGRAYVRGKQTPSANPAPGAAPTPQAQTSPAGLTETSPRESTNADEPQTPKTSIPQPTKGPGLLQIQPGPTPTPQRVITYTVREGDRQPVEHRCPLRVGR